MTKEELKIKLETIKTDLIYLRHAIRNSDSNILENRDNMEFMVRLESMSNMDNEMIDFIAEEEIK